MQTPYALRRFHVPAAATHKPHASPGFAGWVLYQGTRTLFRSYELECEGWEAVRELKRGGRPVVFVGWHGHDFVNIGAYHPVFGADSRCAIMVRDDWGGTVLEHFGAKMGMEVVSLGHDPTSPTWARAVITMIHKLRQGCDLMLAVDGPEGPAHEVKPGAAVIAQRAGAVLVPAACAGERAMHLRYRWDKHLVPVPGTKTTVSLGTPIDTRPADGSKPSVEELSARIGAALDAGTVRARELARERDR